MVRNLECILHDGWQINTAPSAATSIELSLITPKSLQAALEKVVTTFPRAEREDTLNGLADRPLFEQHPASRNLPPHFASSASVESTIREQVATIPALVDDALTRLFGDAGRSSDSSLDTKVIFVIPTVVSIALDNAIRSAAYYSAVEEAVQECKPASPILDAVEAKLVEAPSFMVPVGKFVKHRGKENSVDKTKME